MTRSTVAVWEVLYYGPGLGPAGDGSFVARFRNASDARVFAAGNVYYGRPAEAVRVEVPRRLAQRWGVA